MTERSSRRRNLAPLIIVLILLAVGLYFLLFARMNALALVRPVLHAAGSEEYSAKISVTLDHNGSQRNIQLPYDRFTVNGRSVNATSFESIPFYLADHTLVLENGRQIALPLSPYGSFAPWKLGFYLYWNLPVVKTAPDHYQIQLKDDAFDPLWSLIGFSGQPSAFLNIELSDGELSRISLRALGTAADGVSPLSLIAEASDLCFSSTVTPVDAAFSALKSENLYADPELSKSVFYVIRSFMDLRSRNSFSGELESSSAFLSSEHRQTYTIYSEAISQGRITMLDDGDSPLFIGPHGICFSSGKGISTDLSFPSDLLLSSAYCIIRDGEFRYSEAAGESIVSVLMPGGLFHDLIVKLIPKSDEILDIKFDTGELNLKIHGSQLTHADFRCGGQMSLLFFKPNISIQFDLTIGDLKYSIPDAVLDAIG